MPISDSCTIPVASISEKKCGGFGSCEIELHAHISVSVMLAMVIEAKWLSAKIPMVMLPTGIVVVCACNTVTMEWSSLSSKRYKRRLSWVWSMYGKSFTAKIVTQVA